MAYVIVTTDDGQEVYRQHVDDLSAGTMSWRNLYGYAQTPLGGLGRALTDAKLVQLGLDPRRPSEMAMDALQGATYRIRRFCANEENPDHLRVIKAGLSLGEAQNHCHDPSTRGHDPEWGAWFDGYEVER